MPSAAGAWSFWYSVTTASIAAGATDTPSIPIGGDADFILFGIGGSATSWDFQIQINDASLGRNLMNDWTHGRAVVGSTQAFFSGASSIGTGGILWLPVPYRFQANNSVQFNVKNLSAAANTVYLSLLGIKVRPSAGFVFRAPGGQVVNI